nr:DNA repair protein RecO [Mycoplasmopsis canis]WQQ12515.1 DNA repair protein RecO [Mycoplasmopsis canis]
MSTRISRAIVLDIKLNDDNNHIVTFFTSDGILRLLATGIHKINSKNKNNLHLGSIVEIEFFSARLKNKVGRLKTVNIEKIFDLTNISKIYFFSRIKKLFLNIKEPNHLFELYLRVFDFINKEYYNKLLTFFYAQSLFYFGINPSYDSCRLCNSKSNLINFHLEKGGFICNRHGDEITHESIEYLNAIWASFHSFKKYLIITDFNLDYNIRAKYINIIKEAGYYI